MNRYQSLVVMAAALLAGSVTLASAECGNLGKAVPDKVVSASDAGNIAISSASKKAKKTGMKCTPKHKKLGHC